MRRSPIAVVTGLGVAALMLLAGVPAYAWVPEPVPSLTVSGSRVLREGDLRYRIDYRLGVHPSLSPGDQRPGRAILSFLVPPSAHALSVRGLSGHATVGRNAGATALLIYAPSSTICRMVGAGEEASGHAVLVRGTGIREGTCAFLMVGSILPRKALAPGVTLRARTDPRSALTLDLPAARERAASASLLHPANILLIGSVTGRPVHGGCGTLTIRFDDGDFGPTTVLAAKDPLHCV